MKAIKKIVSQFNRLCANGEFYAAGHLARNNKGEFINMILSGGNDELLYAYKICDIFNMRQTDCFNLKF
jgi:hypothetical protein